MNNIDFHNLPSGEIYNAYKYHRAETTECGAKSSLASLAFENGDNHL